MADNFKNNFKIVLIRSCVGLINGMQLRNAVISGANNILRNKTLVNELNIFPVPDGDTGTNMSMTMSSAVESLKSIGDSATVGEVVKAFVPALLRGARGNSGVILSILFRGFTQLFSDLETVSGSDVVHALGIGVKGAYSAVTKPTEGTMLTVARLAYERAERALKFNNDFVCIWKEICEGAKEALKTTPDLLPVLKKAGVVDAGGKGICLIFDGMLSVFENGVIVDAGEQAGNVDADIEFRNAAAEFDSDITFTYCTEFFVKRNKFCKLRPAKLRDRLQKIGDCVVVVDDEDIIKVHVHTENPGKALQEGIKYGQFLTVKVENMKEQHRIAAEKLREKEASAIAEKKIDVKCPEEAVGFVAVAAGEGVVNLFKDLGCSNVINGGQTMNPSTEIITEAILATPAKTVYVLPNNKNIIMSAQQSVEFVKDRTVVVLPTKTISQGTAAILAYNPESGIQENITNMTEALEKVTTGQVTFAARDSEFGGFKIKEHDILALADGKLLFTAQNPVDAAVDLTKRLVDDKTEFVTLIYGEGISEEQALLAKSRVESAFGGDFEVTLVKGDQPIYYFIISVE